MMSDDKFTRIAAQHLINTRDLVDWGVDGGHTTPDQLRLSVIPRKQIPELKTKGLSNRKIAKLTGVSHQTVGRALNGPTGPERINHDRLAVLRDWALRPSIRHVRCCLPAPLLQGIIRGRAIPAVARIFRHICRPAAGSGHKDSPAKFPFAPA
jgi:hypothetical protein